MNLQVTTALKPDTSYLLEIYEVLENLPVSKIDEIIERQNAIKSGSQALFLAFEQKKNDIPIGVRIVSPEKLKFFQ